MPARDYPFLARAASCAAFLLASQLGCSPKYELLRSVDAGGSDVGGSSSGGTAFAAGGVGTGGFDTGGTGVAGTAVGGFGAACKRDEDCPSNQICCECPATSGCLSTTGGAPFTSCPQGCAPP